MPHVTIGPHEFYYEQHGTGAPLLLIMGLAADSTAWLYQVPAFAERYRTVVFDNRGVGRSAKPSGPYTIAGMADDAAGILDALDIERAHVVGVSMGGMIAQELALRHAERVHGLVLAATYAEPLPELHDERERLTNDLGGAINNAGELVFDMTKLDPMTFFQQMLPRVFTPSFIQQELPRLMQLFSSALQWGFSLEAIVAQAEAAARHQTTDRLSQVVAPTLVVTGDADRLIAPAHSERLASGIPNARLLTVPGGSHGFNFETPDAFNRAVLDFLATVDR